jgi:hypothetical protein
MTIHYTFMTTSNIEYSRLPFFLFALGLNYSFIGLELVTINSTVAWPEKYNRGRYLLLWAVCGCNKYANILGVLLHLSRYNRPKITRI